MSDEVLLDRHLLRVDEVDGSRVAQLLVQEAEEESREDDGAPTHGSGKRSSGEGQEES